MVPIVVLFGIVITTMTVITIITIVKIITTIFDAGFISRDKGAHRELGHLRATVRTEALLCSEDLLYA